VRVKLPEPTRPYQKEAELSERKIMLREMQKRAKNSAEGGEKNNAFLWLPLCLGCFKKKNSGGAKYKKQKATGKKVSFSKIACEKAGITSGGREN